MYKRQERADEILKAMETGMKDDGRSYTSQLLKEKEAMEIINQILIPALDVVGDKFEKGTIFLPQLILAADVDVYKRQGYNILFEILF